MIWARGMKSVVEESPSEEAPRMLGSVGSPKEGPTVVIFGGIHGNEPAGVLALQSVFERLDSENIQLEKGALLGIRGNLQALHKRKRFLHHDLNRLWTKKQLTAMAEKPASERSSEEAEAMLLHSLLKDILAQYKPPYYFIDLHTTSSATLPFITINDAMINRQFSKLFPVPVILGIEEYLDGPLLSYINELGYVSLGFESGQHDEQAAVQNAISFVWQTLVYSGLIQKKELQFFEEEYTGLKRAADENHHFYEVYHRHLLQNSSGFKMEPGFSSFQTVSKGQLLAHNQNKQIIMPDDGMLFMPLYQEQGEEGFFLIRRIPNWALRLSAWMRKKGLQNALHWLPGIQWQKKGEDSLRVNLRIARFFSKQIFHLLGYRSKQTDETHLVLRNRERSARNSDYLKTNWFRPNTKS